MKKMLAAKMGDVPKEQQEMIMKAVGENPRLFMTIAKEAKEKMKSGMDQMQAVIAAAKEYEEELKKILG